jgi:hypothetical protein
MPQQLPVIKAKQRITGADRAKLQSQLVQHYKRGASIRALCCAALKMPMERALTVPTGIRSKQTVSSARACVRRHGAGFVGEQGRPTRRTVACSSCFVVRGRKQAGRSQDRCRWLSRSRPARGVGRGSGP